MWAYSRMAIISLSETENRDMQRTREVAKPGTATNLK